MPGIAAKYFYIKKNILFITIGALVLIGVGCDTSGEEEKSSLRQYKSEITGEKIKDCSTLTPHNPYNNGTGHYAGYEWAQQNGTDCNGNSESFNEGCGEYERQQIDYDNCVYHK